MSSQGNTVRRRFCYWKTLFFKQSTFKYDAPEKVCFGIYDLGECTPGKLFKATILFSEITVQVGLRFKQANPETEKEHFDKVN